MENLVGDFGGAPEIPGDDGPIGRVPARSIRAAQKLSAFPEEEDVQGLLDGRLVAFHDLQEWAPVRLGGAGAPGRPPQGADTGVREGSVWVRVCELQGGGLLQRDWDPGIPPGKCLSAQDLPTPPTALPDSTPSRRVPHPYSPLHPLARGSSQTGPLESLKASRGKGLCLAQGTQGASGMSSNLEPFLLLKMAHNSSSRRPSLLPWSRRCVTGSESSRRP